MHVLLLSFIVTILRNDSKQESLSVTTQNVKFRVFFLDNACLSSTVLARTEELMSNEKEGWCPVNVRIPSLLQKWIARRAALKASTMSHVIRQALLEFVHQEDGEAHAAIIASLVDSDKAELSEAAGG